MKLNFKKGDEGLCIPKSCIPLLTDADICDLRVLLCAASLESAGEKLDAEKIAGELGISASEASSSLKFWHGAGVIKKSTAKKNDDAPVKKEEKADKRPLREKKALHLTTDELCEVAEENPEFKALLDAAQQTAGWIFNTSEIETVASLYTTLRLSGEYILALISYYVCRREKPLRYIEKVAQTLIEEGIDSPKALEEKLIYLERYEGYEGMVRRLFGLGSRALSSREKVFISSWLNDFEYGEDIVREAYERTVNNTGKASISYAHTIMQNWHAGSVKTVSDIAAMSGAKTNAATTRAGTATLNEYDAEAAFEKALKRSYKQNNEG